MSVVRVSVVVPFRDHEDKIGRACSNLATYFRTRDVAFEIIAVDQGSGDNSRSVLALLRRDLPELQVTVGGGYAAGSRKASSRILVLAQASAAAAGVATALIQNIEGVERGEAQMYLSADTLVVCEKDSCAKLLRAGTSRRPQSERQLFEKARHRGLKVLSYGPEAGHHGHMVSRLLASLMPHSRPSLLW